MRADLALFKTVFDGQEEQEVSDDLKPLLDKIRRDQAIFEEYLSVADFYRDIKKWDKEKALFELAKGKGNDDYCSYRLARIAFERGDLHTAYQHISRIKTHSGFTRALEVAILSGLGKIERALEIVSEMKMDKGFISIWKNGVIDYSLYPKRLRVAIENAVKAFYDGT